MGNQANLQRSYGYLYISIRSDFTFGEETYTIDGETPSLSWSSDCCGRGNFFTVKTEWFGLVPSSVDSKTLVNVEKGFLYLQLKFLLENETQNGNMKKNVCFAALFLCNLALITHKAP